MTRSQTAAAGLGADDRALRDRLVLADEDALGEVYDRHASYVYGLARRVIRDDRAAEDVAQEVFLHLWESPARYDPNRGSLRTWLGVLAHRRAVDHVRREEARRRRSEREAHQRIVEHVEVEVEAEAAASITAREVRAALTVLSVEQRTAIELAYFGGCTYRQVADVLGIPEGTAKSRLRLGLRRLADELSARGVGVRGVETWR